MKELVTAVITTYKREPEILRRAVESVVNQTWRPLELYVINDCPEDIVLSDRIRSMILDVQQNHSDLSIQYVPLEHNSGACVARNKGLELAKGEFISFLDDDDTWESEKISEQIGGFTSKKVGMVYSPFYNVDFEGKKELIVRGDKSGVLLDNLLYRNVIGGTSMPMMRTRAMRDIGGFDPDMLSSQDYDTWVRMAEKYEIQFVGKPLTVRYLTGESITTNLKKKESGWLRFTEKYLHYYKDNREAFSNRLSLMVGEMIALNNKKFVNSVLEKYKGLYNQSVKFAYCKAIIKTVVKSVLRKK